MAADLFLSVRGLGKSFQRKRSAPWAVRDVSFGLERRQTLALVGPSGCGKSTLGRCLAGFETADSGEVLLEGRPPQSRAEIQLIPQEPAASLNPRFTAEEAIAEPLVIQKLGTRESQRQAVRRSMEAVGLAPSAACKRTPAFSGGERQRLAIARALTLEPKLLILDESLVGLDASVQTQVVNLLLDLRERRGLTYIVISHDLDLVDRLADVIAVMDQGSIVELGPAAEVLAAPRHPRTQELVRASLLLSVNGPPL